MLKRSTASRVAGLCLALTLILAWAPAGRADSITFGGLELANIQIEDMRDGRVFFINAGGAQVNNEITRIERIKIDTIPDLARGEQLMEERRFDRAISAFESARQSARQKWLQHWIDSRLMRAYDAGLKPVDAIRMFARLVKADADVALLTRRPDNSIVALNAEQKQETLKLLVDLLKDKPKETPAGGLIESLRVQVEQLDVEAAIRALDQAREQGVDITQVRAPLPKTAVALPVAMVKGATDPITRSLMAGDFEQALQQVNASLDNEPAGGLYRRLYQMGVAQLALAEKSDDEKRIKDAGLAFMRIIVYSPRGPYAGPAYIEAGRVHQLIGRPDVARQMWDQASNYIIEDEEPLLYERLDKFKGSLNTGASATDE